MIMYLEQNFVQSLSIHIPQKFKMLSILLHKDKNFVQLHSNSCYWAVNTRILSLKTQL